MSEFEWDAAKGRVNLRKHGVSFEAACRVFKDLEAVDRIDTRFDYGEERFLITGRVEAEVLTLAYCERDERIRIISAKRATKREQ